MTIHVHKLEGCSPTPLAHYLKALAVLRLMSEQRDPDARGWWKDEAFWLSTTLSHEDLVAFFLDTYAPTPILSPWNGGSGFYYENDPGLAPLEQSTAPRFEHFRFGIAAARRVSAPLATAIKRLKETADALKRAGGRDPGIDAATANRQAQTEKDTIKDRLLAECRRTWEGSLLEWLDAAVAIGADGEASWPALLGSGGNDGRLDFTNNSMQHLAALFDLRSRIGAAFPPARPLLLAALFGNVAPGLSDKAAGQFFPGGAGGDNMGRGFESASRINPWDFVLMLEGAILFGSTITRSADAAELAQAAAPFAVRPSASGYGSACGVDEGPRGEQWMPLWSRPGRYTEVHSLFAEGRVRVGRVTATRAIEVARGLSRVGASRGIAEFERYGYIERNGQSNLAVPLGRWAVSAQPHGELLDDITPWIRTFAAFARDKAPKAITSAARVIDEAILGVCRSGTDPLRWQGLLIALGRAESALLRSPDKAGDPKRRLSPLPVLRPSWIDAANDGSSEFRLAAALAGQDAAFRTDGREIFANVRGHWMALDRSRAARRAFAGRLSARFATHAMGLADDSDVVCCGENLERDCIALMRRRVQMAPTLSSRGLGLSFVRAATASLADLMTFLAGQVDDTRIISLARPLMALKWWDNELAPLPIPADAEPDAVYAIVRMAHLCRPLERGEKLAVTLDPEPIARLAAGDLGSAVAVCLRRLRATGLLPTVRVVGQDPRYARRLAASLAFPIHPADAKKCATLVTKPFHSEEFVHD